MIKVAFPPTVGGVAVPFVPTVPFWAGRAGAEPSVSVPPCACPSNSRSLMLPVGASRKWMDDCSCGWVASVSASNII